jgi:hypothetical protein
LELTVVVVWEWSLGCRGLRHYLLLLNQRGLRDLMLILEDTEIRWGMGRVTENWCLGRSTFGLHILLRWEALADHLFGLFLLVALKHASLKVGPRIRSANLVFELILEEIFINGKI